MCGIAGIVLNEVSRPLDRGGLDVLAAAIRHRGPDAADQWVRGNIGLAHARLSILDLATGDQPMADPAGSVVLVFNGQIYNYRDLRLDLERAGHSFRTMSDTEVVLQAYLTWGSDCVRRFNGMWALALADWRGAAPRVWCSRDRLGVKPFYYRFDSRRLMFASELKALAAGGAAEIDRHALNDYFVFGPRGSGACWLDGVQELPAGCSLHWRDGRISTETYFALADTFGGGGRIATDELDHLLCDSVRLRLHADVPVATINSGGLDSSLLSALAKQQQRDLTTYAVAPAPRAGGNGRLAGDESAEAERMARWLGTAHRTVRYDPAEFMQDVDAVATANDGEVFHSNSVAMHRLFARIRADGFKVVLGGEGADEVFRGYYTERLRRLTAPLGRSFLRSLLAWKARDRGHLVSMFQASEQIIANLRMSRFSPTAATRLTGLPFELHEDRLRLFVTMSQLESGDALAYFEQTAYLAGLLRRADRMAMAHGVELRVPYLDYRLLVTLNRLSPARKAGVLPGTEKRLLRSLGRRYLPAFVAERRKYGFGTPLTAYRQELRQRAERLWPGLSREPLNPQQLWVLSSALPPSVALPAGGG